MLFHPALRTNVTISHISVYHAMIFKTFRLVTSNLLTGIQDCNWVVIGETLKFMPGSRHFCQRGSNPDKVCIYIFIFS